MVSIVLHFKPSQLCPQAGSVQKREKYTMPIRWEVKCTSKFVKNTEHLDLSQQHRSPCERWCASMGAEMPTILTQEEDEETQRYKYSYNTEESPKFVAQCNEV